MIHYSIIIPVLNHWPHTEQCLHSLKRNTNLSNVEIIVVNNGSHDQTAQGLEVLRSEIPNLRIISLESNSGFSYACNLGAREAKGEYLLFLNNDTIVLPNWLPPLAKRLQDQEHLGFRAVGPKLLYPFSLTINHCGYVYNAAQSNFYAIYHNFDEEEALVCYSREAQALLGAALLVTKEAFFEVDGFQEMGLEDIDLCLSLREKGYRLAYEPQSRVMHYGSLTLKHFADVPQMNTQKFHQKWNSKQILADDSFWYEREGLKLIDLGSDLVEVHSSQDPSFELLFCGIRLVRARSYDQGKQYLLEALHHSPRRRAILQWLTVVSVAQSDWREALRYTEKSLALYSTIPDSLWSAATLSENLGEYSKQRGYLERALSLPDLPLEIKHGAREKLSRLGHSTQVGL